MRTYLILMALGASTAAFAGEPSSGGAPAAKPEAQKEKVVCINEPDVGTRIPKRTCKTQAQWDEDRREAREMLERSTRTQTNPSGG